MHSNVICIYLCEKNKQVIKGIVNFILPPGKCLKLYNMKKTITINLGGAVFSIDEDAYELLKEYLDKIEGHFSDEGERQDIMSDIESRIAELLSGGSVPHLKPITISEVKKVIEIMGDPSDIADAVEDKDQDPGSGSATGSSGSHEGSRRMHRDVDNRILGGVCSGMAAYWSIDVIWIRIIFVILALGAFSGVFIYLLLWLVIPPAITTAQKLEMKGEPVNISNIGKAVKEEFNSVRKNLKI